MTTPLRSAAARVLLLVVAALVTVLLSPTTAQAHTGLVGSTPAPAARLVEPPVVVVLEFAEPVAADRGSVHVLDPGGVDRAAEVLVSHDGRVVSVVLDPRGPAGRWLVEYQVRGSDGHVVDGGLAYAVGSGDVDGWSVSLAPVPALLLIVGVGAAAYLLLVVWLRRTGT
jgi:methionine-rich copper-binding protein CopC